jgi:hypothetical protein
MARAAIEVVAEEIEAWLSWLLALAGMAFPRITRHRAQDARYRLPQRTTAPSKSRFVQAALIAPAPFQPRSARGPRCHADGAVAELRGG